MKHELRIEKGPVPREQIVARDPLGDYLVWWDDVATSHLDAFRCVLDAATQESDLQRHLESDPMLLVQSMRGGHGRWAIPQQRLGSEFVTDFVVGEKSSMGFSWLAVELESPKVPMFTKAGDPSCYLTHAIRQVTDWRAWLKDNQNYAARLRSEHGLGLTDISPGLEGLILIGRRSGLDSSTNARRRQMCEDLRVQIHTFDWLLDVASERAEWATNERQRRNDKTIQQNDAVDGVSRRR